VEQLNDSVTRSAKGEKFITMFICKFDVYTKELRYINAGHNPPVLISNDNVMLLEEGTIGLGMFEQLPLIKEGVIQAKPDNEYLLFCYTDGVVELEDENGEHFGLTRLEHFLRENAHISTMNELQSRIVQHLYDFKESKPFLDDIALLACRCSF
jgi:sigma-B regulation protein RsbU (phosphoserine phosphatase)